MVHEAGQRKHVELVASHCCSSQKYREDRCRSNQTLPSFKCKLMKSMAGWLAGSLSTKKRLSLLREVGSVMEEDGVQVFDINMSLSHDSKFSTRNLRGVERFLLLLQ